MERGNKACKAILDGLTVRLGIGIVLCDAEDKIVWTNDCVETEFPAVFSSAAEFTRVFDKLTSTETDDSERVALQKSLERLIAPGTVHRLRRAESEPAYYRHLQFALDDGSYHVHCLVNISEEKRLEETFLSNLHQLASMKEIIDILYESLSTQEVLYLILVAVTAHMGFGFNRAFYLESYGDRLRGKIGIGPSSAEDANRIWSRLAQLNLPTLRAHYQDLTRDGKPPDPQTQEIAGRMDFRIRPTTEGLMGALERGDPTLIHNGTPGSEVDTALFELLRTDEAAVVPLYVRQSLAGVLIADNFITRKPITDHDLSVLKTFSDYAGVALERSQLYDELRQSIAKLQSANETLKSHQLKLLQAEKLSAIGELAAYVSHEIRNPLVAIGGLARSLLKDVSLGSESQDSLQIIATEVTRLERFLRETLDFVKPEVMGTSSLDLRDEVTRCLSPFRSELSDDAIELELDLGPSPLRCLIDPDLFHRALSNLIKNAIEAIGKSGTIRIGARCEGGSAEVSVADSGPGIPPELRSRALEPFFTTKPEGTGLGLAIASQGIRNLGGHISFQENERFKTIVNINLPLENGSAQANRREEAEEKERIGT